MTVFSHFEQQIQQQDYLIALSGGLDSSVLLALFAKLRQKRPRLSLRAIHIHHGLSPNADQWLAHCQQYCQQFSIEFITQHVQVNGKNGIESSAREARYHAIARHIRPNETLVTAHHLNDQSETFLLALKRGSGLKGLSAMQRQSQMTIPLDHNQEVTFDILRPLLDLTRSQLEQYALAQKLKWVEDESNQDNRYDRNFLRNVILPPLRQRWKHIDQAIARSAKHCAEQQQLLNELLQQTFSQYYQPQDHSFNIADFADCSPIKQRALLRLWLTELQQPMPSLQQLTQLIQDVVFTRQDANPQFQLGKKVVRRYQQRLYLTDLLTDISQWQSPIQVGQKITLPDNLGEIIINAEKTQGFLTAVWGDKCVNLPQTDEQITLRFAYSGKVKFGNHHESMKKIWQQLGVAPWLRSRIPLIFYGDQFQAALGYFQLNEPK